MSDNKEILAPALTYTERLKAPYTDIELRIAAMEKAYKMRQVYDASREQEFNELPRHKRMSRMYDFFSHEAELARNQTNRIAKQGGELMTSAQANLECSEGKVSSLLSLERALSVADFIRRNNINEVYLVGLKITGKIEVSAGDRLLGHLARFGAMLDGVNEEPYEYDYSSLLDTITPSETHPIFTLGSTVVSASGFYHEGSKRTTEGVFALHLSHDYEKYEITIPEQRLSETPVSI